MFCLALFYKLLIINERGIVFGRQGPEVYKIAWSDFGPQSDPQGEAQGCAESNLLTQTSFSLSRSIPYSPLWSATVFLRDLFAGVLRGVLESRLHKCSLVSATGQDTSPLSNPA
jgi:hypothetical protein